MSIEHFSILIKFIIYVDIILRMEYNVNNFEMFDNVIFNNTEDKYG